MKLTSVLLYGLRAVTRTLPRVALAAALLSVGTTPPAAAQLARQAPTGITGTVVDAQTGTALPATRVRVLEPHRAEITHESGAFTFENLAPGTYTLVVERLGYRTSRQPVEVRSGELRQVRVELSVAAVELEGIMVTGTLSGRAGKEVLSPTSVVSGAELDRRIGGTVAATLEDTPGVSVASVGPATARPVIRGLSGDRILVLEDGLRPGDLSSTSGDHAIAIEPLTAERIEVVRGPMSLLYGSSALGGVVNVIREEIPTSLPEHTHGLASLQGTSVNRGATAGAYATTRAGQFALRVEGSARGSGNVQTPVGELVNTDATTLNLSAGGAYVGPWGHAGASYRFYDNEYGIPGGFVGAHPQGVDIQMRRHMVRGETELHPDRGMFSAVRAGGAFTDYRHFELESSGRIGTSFGQQLAAGDFLARHETFGQLAEGAVGLRAQYRDIRTGGSLRTPSTYDYTLAGFVVEEVGQGALRMQAGARYDWARYVPRDTTAFVTAGGERVPVRPRTFGSVSGSLGLLYEVFPEIRVGASLNRAYRTPDFNELYSNGPHLAANSYDVGDPSLAEETGLGIDGFIRVSRPQLRAEVAAFRNQLNNYIFPSSRGRVERGLQGGRPRFQYTNEDAVFTGLEGDVDWSVTPRLVVEGTASYVRGTFTSAREEIPVFNGADTTFIAASVYPPFIPPLNGRVGVRYEDDRYFLGGGVRMAARQERLGDFEDPTAGYATGNVSAGVRLFRGSRLHMLTLSVDNVLDTEYRNHLSRVKEIMPEPGRNISLLYRLSF
jgi:iron complex outermembrane receptor protein